MATAAARSWCDRDAAFSTPVEREMS